MPAVSVLMPARNAVPFIRAAVRSVLEQTVRDLELVVVDDGSTDATATIVAGIRDKRIRLLRNAEPLGVTRSLNRGLEVCTGPVIARMDADDVCRRDRLARQLTFLRERPRVGLCGSWVRCFGRGRSYVLEYPCGPEVVDAYVLFDNPFAHAAVCFRREVLDRFGLRYDERVRTAQDFELWVRWAAHTAIDNVPEPLLNLRLHDRSVTAQQQARSDDQASRIVKGQLDRLGIGAGAEEVRFHRRVGHGAGLQSLGEVSRAENWLLRLMACNREVRAFPIQGLAGAAGFVWFRVCQNSAFLGGPAWRAYRRSVLAREYRPRRAARLVFMANVVRAAAGLGSRGPAGRFPVWDAMEQGACCAKMTEQRE